MRYKDEPWRNRVLGDGWSHNLYKRLHDDQSDPDIRATVIAEKYIRLFTERMKQRGWLPLVGAEVNFIPYGVDEQVMVDTINEMTRDARSKARVKVDTTAIDTALAALRASPIIAPSRPNSSQAYDLNFHGYEPVDGERYTPPKPPSGHAEMDRLNHLIAAKIHKMDIELFEDRARMLSQEGTLSQYDINQFYMNLYSIAKSTNQESLLKLDANAFNACKQYCEAMVEAKSYPREAGIFSRVYHDGESPEIATPPRAPIDTVRNVNSVKQLLMESTYRFHNDPRTSDIATRLRERLGDIDISFLFPSGYGNLPEHLNLSIQQRGEGRMEYADLRHAGALDASNLLRIPSVTSLFQKAYGMFLPADRLLTIGNKFPYHEAQQMADPKIATRIDSFTRVDGRVELKNFNDACSNIALSMLGVLAVTTAVQETLEGENLQDCVTINGYSRLSDRIDTMRAQFTPVGLPKTPAEGVRSFRDHSVTLQMMRRVAADMAMPDERAAAEAEIREFEQCVVRRQEILLKRPWGGKQRAAAERANGWQIPMVDKASWEARTAQEPPENDTITLS